MTNTEKIKKLTAKNIALARRVQVLESTCRSVGITVAREPTQQQKRNVIASMAEKVRRVKINA